MSRKYRRKYLTRHHIIPRSRGGTSSLDNLCDVTNLEHSHYHTLFENKTPVEIIYYLIETFMGGKWSYLEAAQEYRRNRRV